MSQMMAKLGIQPGEIEQNDGEWICVLGRCTTDSIFKHFHHTVQASLHMAPSEVMARRENRGRTRTTQLHLSKMMTQREIRHFEHTERTYFPCQNIPYSLPLGLELLKGYGYI